MAFNIWMGMYFVDVLFAEDFLTESAIEKKLSIARTLALFCVLPMALLHGWDHLRISLDVFGHTQQHLAASLFRKYLNYNAESRAKTNA